MLGSISKITTSSLSSEGKREQADQADFLQTFFSSFVFFVVMLPGNSPCSTQRDARKASAMEFARCHAESQAVVCSQHAPGAKITWPEIIYRQVQTKSILNCSEHTVLYMEGKLFP